MEKTFLLSLDSGTRQTGKERKVPVLIHLTQGMINALDEEVTRMGADNRSQLVRTLLSRSLPNEQEGA